MQKPKQKVVRQIQTRREKRLIQQAIKTGKMEILEELYEDIIFDLEMKLGPQHQADLRKLKRKFSMFNGVDIQRDLYMPYFDADFNPIDKPESEKQEIIEIKTAQKNEKNSSEQKTIKQTKKSTKNSPAKVKTNICKQDNIIEIQEDSLVTSFEQNTSKESHSTADVEPPSKTFQIELNSAKPKEFSTFEIHLKKNDSFFAEDTDFLGKKNFMFFGNQRGIECEFLKRINVVESDVFVNTNFLVNEALKEGMASKMMVEKCG